MLWKTVKGEFKTNMIFFEDTENLHEKMIKIAEKDFRAQAAEMHMSAEETEAFVKKQLDIYISELN